MAWIERARDGTGMLISTMFSKGVINIIIEGGAYWKQGTRMKSNQSTEGTMYMHMHLHVVL